MQLKDSFIIIATSVAFCQTIVAEELTEVDFLSEEPLITSSITRLNQKIHDIPASLTIINREMIEASSATTIVELMRLVPGFQVGFKYGNEGTVTYHGLSGETNKRLHVLINGRSTYNPLIGGTLWQTLPITLDDIHSIEVVRGPNAATYGANSFSGVINIKTYSALEPDGTQVSLAYGPQRELKRIRAIHDDHYQDIGYRLTFEYEDNKGFPDAYREKNDVTQIPILEINDDMKKLLLNSQFEFSQNHFSHNFELGIVNQELGMEYDKLGFVGIPVSYKDIFSMYGQYTLSQQVNLLTTNKLKIAHNYTDFDNKIYSEDGDHKPNTRPNPPAIPDIGVPNIDGHPVNTSKSFESHRLDLDLSQSKILSPGFQYVWGGGMRYDYGSSEDYFQSGSEDRFSARLNAHMEWKALDQLTLNLGGLYEYYEDLDAFLSPRAAANIHLTNNQTIKTSWSRAYRMPTLIDQYANLYNYDSATGLLHDWDTVGNPDIESEEIESLELGYMGNFFERKLVVDLRLAKEKIKNVIEQPKTPSGKRNLAFPRWRIINFGIMEIDSAELDITIRPTKDTFIKAYGAYANAYGERAKESSDNSFTPNPSKILTDVDAYVPLFSSGFLVSHSLNENLRISAQYNYVDAYTTSGEGDEIDRLETFDIKLSKSFNTGEKPTEFIATVKNVFDNEYQDFDIDNEVSLEAYFELKMQL